MRRIRKARSVCEQDRLMLWMCSQNERLLVVVTPKILIVVEPLCRVTVAYSGGALPPIVCKNYFYCLYCLAPVQAQIQKVRLGVRGLGGEGGSKCWGRRRRGGEKWGGGLKTDFRPNGGLYHHCRSHSSVASLIAPEQWCVFCTPSLATFPTCCYQLDSNLAN